MGNKIPLSNGETRSTGVFNVCKVCRVTPIKQGKFFTYKTQRHSCIACDVANGQTYSFVKGQKYDELETCDSCYLRVVTRSYEVDSTLDMCPGCWKTFNTVE